jgi:hypothetical protein
MITIKPPRWVVKYLLWTLGHNNFLSLKRYASIALLRDLSLQFMFRLLTGPFELPPRHPGFLLHLLTDELLQVGLLEDVQMTARQTVWFMPHGAHFAHGTKQFLACRSDWWIGRNEPVLWPPWSPVFPLADLYRWGLLNGVAGLFTGGESTRASSFVVSVKRPRQLYDTSLGFFGLPGIPSVNGLSYAFSATEKISSNFRKRFVNINTLLYWNLINECVPIQKKLMPLPG